ncbi:uncharacterized protein [Ptychodera flava]|uniref:uncharacterized protein isoform X1 n=1 Tax=Ptychodera flava TaxID=63121 RepID=UPI00396A099A
MARIMHMKYSQGRSIRRSAAHRTLSKPFKDIFDTHPRVRPRPTLYDVLPLMHPVNRERVVFSSNKPNFTPIVTLDEFPSSASSSISKRQGIATEACPSVSDWVRPSTARDTDNREVQLYSMQWFWRTTCEDPGTACIGFVGASKCRSKRSWVIAWARETADDSYRWMWVAIETCCTCAIYRH